MAATEPPTPARWIAIGTAMALLAAAAIGVTIMAFWSNLFRDAVDSALPPDTRQEALAPRHEDDPFAAARQRMVDEQLRGRDITDPNVLKAMGRVARDRFAPTEMQSRAYEDHPLPIGLGQTISQPYIVALMTQLARPTPPSRALEIGVGSGYQTAILAELCKEVYGVEILRPLADGARERLAALGYRNVTIRCGDGYRGWPEHAPFDVILVTAAPDHVPQPLLEQLAPGGRLVIPVGRGFQELLLIEKRADGSLNRRSVAPVQFVPMTGEAERGEE
jgi:protein-L-isoaspartate(D-aspartate) O-methyltransferase